MWGSQKGRVGVVVVGSCKELKGRHSLTLEEKGSGLGGTKPGMT